MPDLNPIFRAARACTGKVAVRILVITSDGEEIVLTNPPRHGPDFRSVVWFGQRYSFTQTQASVVRVLWEAWEDGSLDVGQAYLLEAAGSDTGQLRDIFKDCAAWNTLIVPGESRGTWRLGEPKPPE